MVSEFRGKYPGRPKKILGSSSKNLYFGLEGDCVIGEGCRCFNVLYSTFDVYQILFSLQLLYACLLQENNEGLPV